MSTDNVIPMDADIRKLKMSLKAFNSAKQQIANLEYDNDLMRDVVDAAKDWRQMVQHGRDIDVARALTALEISIDLYVSETEDGG